MRLWRISDHADLSGSGGLLASGRWHSRGRKVVYLSDHPASALLEILVQLEIDPEDIPSAYQLLAIDISDEVRLASVEGDDLPPDWREKVGATRALGDQWLAETRTVRLRVPSALVPFGFNWLVNPGHADVVKVAVAEIIRAPLDPRLLG